MKRVERSPIASPKKLGNASLKSCMATDHQTGIRKKSAGTTNSVHISPPYGSGTISSDEDSDNFSVDKVRAIRNQVKLRFVSEFVSFGKYCNIFCFKDLKNKRKLLQLWKTKTQKLLQLSFRRFGGVIGQGKLLRAWLKKL